MEQDTYNAEGISWKHIEFVDNQSVLDLIGVKPLNLMALIDEEGKFPKVKKIAQINNSPTGSTPFPVIKYHFFMSSESRHFRLKNGISGTR